jgi:neuroligin
LLVFRNPNEYHRQDTILAGSKERNRFRNIVWDEYDSVHQKYLEISEYCPPPEVP